MKLIHYDTAIHLAQRALEQGGRQTSLTTVLWEIAGRCESPYLVTLCGRPEPGKKLQWRFDPLEKARRLAYFGRRESFIGKNEKLPIFIDIEARCRKCPTCLRQKSMMWRSRMENEIHAANRTWFGTLTVSPSQRILALSEARKQAAQQGQDFDVLPAPEQFKAMVRVLGYEVTKFLKRLRTDTEAKLRYVVVCEPHKDGSPHFHILIHCRTALDKVTKRCLHKHWHFGFSSWKIIKDGLETDHDDLKRAARYVAKYIAKSPMTRIRASVSYGKTLPHALGILKSLSNNTPSNGGSQGGDDPPSLVNDAVTNNDPSMNDTSFTDVQTNEDCTNARTERLSSCYTGKSIPYPPEAPEPCSWDKNSRSTFPERVTARRS